MQRRHSFSAAKPLDALDLDGCDLIAIGTVEPLEDATSGRMPEPYRSLLVHEDDMTSTLERFHREPLGLRILGRHVSGETLRRRVLLVGQESGTIVELGAIRIQLERFAPPARLAVEAGEVPLGAILAAHGIAFRSRPVLFFALEPSPQVRALLGLEREGVLFGRRNQLETPAGEAIAEVVEILPPLAEALAG